MRKQVETLEVHAETGLARFGLLTLVAAPRQASRQLHEILEAAGQPVAQEYHQQDEAGAHDKCGLAADDTPAKPEGQTSHRESSDKGSHQCSPAADEDIDGHQQGLLDTEDGRVEIVGPGAEQGPGKTRNSPGDREKKQLVESDVVTEKFGLDRIHAYAVDNQSEGRAHQDMTGIPRDGGDDGDGEEHRARL